MLPSSGSFRTFILWMKGRPTFPPHCNRFQMVLDMVVTLNTRGKRSALVRGVLDDWTHVLLSVWLLFFSAFYDSQHQYNSHPASVPLCVPTQEHRFQMVLDGILDSKTPSETSFLGRRTLRTFTIPNPHLKNKQNGRINRLTHMMLVRKSPLAVLITQIQINILSCLQQLHCPNPRSHLRSGDAFALCDK